MANEELSPLEKRYKQWYEEGEARARAKAQEEFESGKYRKYLPPQIATSGVSPVVSAPTAETISKYNKMDEFNKRLIEQQQREYEYAQEYNHGDFWGGAGYVVGRIGQGILQFGEGLVDIVGGGIAYLTGNEDVAKDYFFGNNTVQDMIGNPLQKAYNPDKVMSVVGDVAQGVGYSAPSIVLSIPTAGASTWAQIGTTFATSAIPAFGAGVSEAYQTTGELGGKEFGYGFLSALVEGAAETAGDIAGLGMGVLRNQARSAVSKGVSRLTFGSVLKAGIGEGMEELASGLIDPAIKRLTKIDPNAQWNAGDIAYETAIGFLSGFAMSGVSAIGSRGSSVVIGSWNKANAQSILSAAGENISVLQNTGWTADNFVKYLSEYRDTYAKLNESLKKTGGKVETVSQMTMLGDLIKANAKSVAVNVVQNEAYEVLKNPEATVEALNNYAKIAGSPVVNYTADMLTEGIDYTNGKAFSDSVNKRIQSDTLLHKVAVLQAANQMMMNDEDFYTLYGQRNARYGVTQQTLNQFVEESSKTPEGMARMQALGNAMGIGDIRTASAEDFNKAYTAFKANGGTKGAEAIAEIRTALQGKKTASLPKNARLIKQGIHKYKINGNEVGLQRQGDVFRVYDPKTGDITVGMNAEQTNDLLTKIKDGTAKIAKAEQARNITEQEVEAKAKDIVKDYENLGESRKQMVRKVIRQAYLLGVNEQNITDENGKVRMTGDEIVANAVKVVAIKGFDLDFRASMRTETGRTALGSTEGFSVQISAETVGRTGVDSTSATIGHEVSHILSKLDPKHILAKYAERHLNSDTRKAIADQYAGITDQRGITEEYVGRYSAEVFSQPEAWDFLLSEKPSLVDKIKQILSGNKTYQTVGKSLTAEQRKFLRLYKQLFDSEKTSIGRMELRESKNDVGGKRYSFSSISKSFGASMKELENGSYKNTEGYKTYLDSCVKNYMKTHKQTQSEDAVRKSLANQIDGIVKVAVAMKKQGFDITTTEAEDAKLNDGKGGYIFSSLEPNSDYWTSFDISTICEKRKPFQWIYDEIVKFDPSFFKNIDNFFVLHKIMAENGLVTPCRECYVESMRKNLGPMAESFMNLINSESDTGKENNDKIRRLVREYLKENGMSTNDITLDMLQTAEGITQLKLQHYRLYELFNSYYGQAKPKLPKKSVPFRFGELTAMLTDEKGNIRQNIVDKINETGGFRIQSYGDFNIENTADILQVLFEASTLGLSGHAYTKVPAFLEVTKNTGLKRNISIFTKNENGNWVIDTKESFPGLLNNIYEIVRSDKNGDTGIICVVQNVENAVWAMANNEIAYFIPYHKSGMRMKLVTSRVGYEGTIDHTRWQNEKDISTGKKSKKHVDIYLLWDYSATGKNGRKLSQNEIIRRNLTAYLNKCEEMDLIPKFAEKYLTKETADSVLTEIRKTNPDATEASAYFRYEAKKAGKTYYVPYGYYKCLGDFNFFDANGNPAPHKPLSLAKYNFADTINMFSSENAIKARKTELLQKLTPSAIKENNLSLNSDIEDIQSVIEQAKEASVRQAIGEKQYSLPSPESEAKQGERKVKTTKSVLEGMRHRAEQAFGEQTFDTKIKVDGKWETKQFTATAKVNIDNETFANLIAEWKAANGNAKIQAIKDLLLYLKNHTDFVSTDSTKRQFSSKKVFSGRSSELAKIYRGILRSVTATATANRMMFLAPASVPNTSVYVQTKEERVKDSRTARERIHDAGIFGKIMFVDSMSGIVDVLVKGGMTPSQAETAVQNMRRATQTATSVIANEGFDIAAIVKEYGSIWEFGQAVESGKVKDSDFEKYRTEGLHKIREDVFKAAKDYAKSRAGEDIHGDAEEQYLADFYDYLLNMHNIDRLSLEEKHLDTNKPVFAIRDKKSGRITQQVTEEQSAKRAKDHLNDHPEFKELAERIYKYEDFLMRIRLNGGLITQEDYDYYKNKYPHYVPTYRDITITPTSPARGNQSSAEVRNQMKKVAKGGSEKIVPIFEQLARDTLNAVRASEYNKLAIAVFNSKNGYTVVERVKPKQISVEDIESPVINEEDERTRRIDKSKKTVTFYMNGEKITIKVTDNLFRSFDDVYRIDSEMWNNLFVKGAVGAMNIFKKAVTAWNPAFMVRNFFRDTGDALINSEQTLGFAKNRITGQAIRSIAKDSIYWRLYMASGAMQDSLFNNEEGFANDAILSKRGLKVIKKRANGNKAVNNAIYAVQSVGNLIEKGNIIVEQSTRYNEFYAVLKKGGSLEDAMRAAADVTVNFGRSGTVTRVLNKVAFPFLNPAVQGFDRYVRLLVTPAQAQGISTKQKAKKIVVGFAKLALKLAVVGIAWRAIQDFLYRDDDDYQELTEYTKSSNYLIKIGDGKFIKIPTGRMQATLATAYEAIVSEDVTAGDAVSTAVSNLTPVENVSRSIVAPLRDVATNTTWYGGKIEGANFENVRPSERYDESTSAISKMLGKVLGNVFGLSPKKIDYLIDQYTGVFGDVLISLTNDKAEDKLPLLSQFVTDSAVSNGLSDKFYKLYDEARYSKSDDDDTAVYQVKYLNKVKGTISDMYQEIHDIQNSDLPRDEKLEKVRTVRALINEAYRNAINNYDSYTGAIESTSDSEVTIRYPNLTSNAKEDIRYADINRKTFGAEYALKTYNTQAYEKWSLVSKSGIGFDKIYDYYFAIKGIEADVDKNGNAIAGSKKKKVIAKINKMRLTNGQKLLLIYASGYSYQDGDIKGLTATKAKTLLLQTILKSKATKAEKEELAKMCGFTVKNGKIVTKS